MKNIQKYCRVCKIILTSENSCPSNRIASSDYLCRVCERNIARIYYRKNIVCTIRNGKRIELKGKKRPYPKDIRCEVCKKSGMKLIYHHWNDLDISKGIWVDTFCHGLAEGVDKNNHIKYLKLRNYINYEN